MLTEYMEVVLIPAIVGILQWVVKPLGVNDKFIPLISLALGLVAGIVFNDLAIKEGIMAGILMGLSAIGAYSGTKNVIQGMKKPLS